MNIDSLKNRANLLKQEADALLEVTRILENLPDEVRTAVLQKLTASITSAPTTPAEPRKKRDREVAEALASRAMEQMPRSADDYLSSPPKTRSKSIQGYKYYAQGGARKRWYLQHADQTEDFASYEDMVGALHEHLTCHFMALGVGGDPVDLVKI